MLRWSAEAPGPASFRQLSVLHTNKNIIRQEGERLGDRLGLISSEIPHCLAVNTYTPSLIYFTPKNS